LVQLYESDRNIKVKNIIYESGSPVEYKDEFLKLWLVHMEYINSIQNFSSKKADVNIFNESLNKFISKHRNVKLFVAKEDKKLIGFLQAGTAFNDKYGFISDLHVEQFHRRSGIGKNLLINCLEWFKENKIQDIGLEVIGGNDKALNFYKRNGFDIDMYSLKLTNP
jgi:ribosomal protein S18 acetylase RimI-like enzyme